MSGIKRLVFFAYNIHIKKECRQYSCTKELSKELQNYHQNREAIKNTHTERNCRITDPSRGFGIIIINRVVKCIFLSITRERADQHKCLPHLACITNLLICCTFSGFRQIIRKLILKKSFHQYVRTCQEESINIIQHIALWSILMPRYSFEYFLVFGHQFGNKFEKKTFH